MNQWIMVTTVEDKPALMLFGPGGVTSIEEFVGSVKLSDGKQSPPLFASRLRANDTAQTYLLVRETVEELYGMLLLGKAVTPGLSG